MDHQCAKIRSFLEKLDSLANSKNKDDIIVDDETMSMAFEQYQYTKLMICVMSASTYPNYKKLKKKMQKYKLKYSINLKNARGTTALMIACRNSNTISNNNCVRILLNNKADINSQDNWGWTALLITVACVSTYNNIELPEMLMKVKGNFVLNQKDAHSMLETYCRKAYPNFDSNLDTLKLLLQYGANPNIKNYWGVTPLLMACKYFKKNPDIYYDVINLLLDANANVKIRDKKRNTALMLLLKSKPEVEYWPVVERLMKLSSKLLLVRNSEGENCYDIYTRCNLDIMTQQEINILKGEIPYNLYYI